MTAIQNMTKSNIHWDWSRSDANGVPIEHKKVVIPAMRLDMENENIVLEDGIVEVDDAFFDEMMKRPGVAALFDDGQPGGRKLRIVARAEKKAVIHEGLGGIDPLKLQEGAREFGANPDNLIPGEDLNQPISPSLNEQKKAVQAAANPAHQQNRR